MRAESAVDACFFCYRQEPGPCKPVPGCDFICSGCVQKNCRASQDQIKSIYQKAVDGGQERKAEILESFMLEGEEENEQRNPKRDTSKCAYRKGSLRTPRNEQKPDWKFKKSEKPTFHQNYG